MNGLPIQDTIEGILSTEPGIALYGGTNEDDNSGSMSFVRIEYGGKAVAPGNEVNGLTMGGVGRGTSLHHIQVRQTTDDCFEWFGGTVDGHHLICQAPGDDGFDWDQGYTGRLQFLVLQHNTVTADLSTDPNGIEADNSNANNAWTPVSNPTLYNATMCGFVHASIPNGHFGAVLRRGTLGTLRNFVVSGFGASVDVRNATGPQLIFTDSLFVHDTLQGQVLAWTEMGASPNNDDDAGFNEVAWITGGTNNEVQASNGGTWLGCNNTAALDLAPTVAEPGVAPPNDGFFDETADFKGAFRDATDTWASGAWVSWLPN